MRSCEMFGLNSVMFVALLCCTAGSVAAAHGAVTVDTATAGRIELCNGLVKIVMQSTPGGITEEYSSHAGGWHVLMRSGNGLRTEPALKSDGRLLPAAFTEATLLERSAERCTIALRGQVEGHEFSKTLTLDDGKPYVHALLEDRVRGAHELSYFLSTYSFVPDGKSYREYQPLDFVWTPQLRPDSMDVIADHTFRSPALMFQKGELFAALIPDVDLIQPWRTVQTAADVQVTGSETPMMSYGAMNWAARSHVFYTHTDKMTSLLNNSSVSFGYFLYLNAHAELRQGYEDVVRFHWERSGRKNLLQSRGPQAEPFSADIRKAWADYMPSIALDTQYNGRPVTLLRQGRLAWSNGLPPAAGNDCWFNIWFSSLRTAYGMYMHGKDTGDTTLQHRAIRVLNLALSAPQHDGIAPTIFYLDSAGGHWVADHAWGGIEGGKNLPTFHNAWTCCWLLAWWDVLPNRRDEIMHYTRAFADFLLAHQQKSGVIPSWFDSLTLEPAQPFRDENAETAGAALFLAEFYARIHEQRYLEAAEHAMQYVHDRIIPENKWFDFETFYSCSRKVPGFYDLFSRQYPQNTLSIHQAAEACCSLYRSTGKELYKSMGVALIDYLCLYQQVWSPPWLSRQLFGGFGVQNTDGEWSDARQGYFAVTLMNYYEVTGDREYFERGVAALRAMFALYESPESPRTFENYAHSAIDRPGGVTGLHWGTGSCVVSIHLIRSRYGDAFVNVDGEWGVGIDGCTITKVAVRDAMISLDVRDDVHVPRTLTMRFTGVSKPGYTLRVNGKVTGTYASRELRKGIDVAI